MYASNTTQKHNSTSIVEQVWYKLYMFNNSSSSIVLYSNHKSQLSQLASGTGSHTHNFITMYIST